MWRCPSAKSSAGRAVAGSHDPFQAAQRPLLPGHAAGNLDHPPSARPDRRLGALGEPGRRTDRVLDHHGVAQPPCHAGVHAVGRARPDHVALHPLAGCAAVDAMASRSSGGRLLGRRHLAPPAQGRPGPEAITETDRLWRTLQRLPDLHSVVGPDGSARHASSRHAHRPHEQVDGAGATVIRLRAPALQIPTVLVELLRLRRRLAADPDLLRSVVGLGWPGEVCFLGIWRAGDRAAGCLDDEWVRRTASRWAGSFWASQWLSEHEFGHWDGLRLRRLRRGVPDQPPAAD